MPLLWTAEALDVMVRIGHWIQLQAFILVELSVQAVLDIIVVITELDLLKGVLTSNHSFLVNFIERPWVDNNPGLMKYYIFLRRQRQRRRWRRRWWRRWRRRRKELLKINISKILDVITSFFLKLIWVFSWTSLHRNADPSFWNNRIQTNNTLFQIQQLPQTFRRRCWNRDYYNDIRHLSWNFLSFELREANSFWSP